MTAPATWTRREVMETAARGMGKIDLYGARGTTLVSQTEIEAMAVTLALLGLLPIPPRAAEYAAEYAAGHVTANTLKGPSDV